MKIRLAEHFGMCFGVRDALQLTHNLAQEKPVTVLGQLVHNQVVRDELDRKGVRGGRLEEIRDSPTHDVVITAHGASDTARNAWREAGFNVHDTTCPLVRKAHKALAMLVAQGYSPVVVGKADHVEVKGLVEDFPGAQVILSLEEVNQLGYQPKFGVVSQTTQPLDKVRQLIEALKSRHPESEIVFRDTVCQPTKDRQRAMEKLCQENELVIVVGGHNSNNTHQLLKTARGFGVEAHHVECADEIESSWFLGVESVGITAGTSTLPGTVSQVRERIREIADHLERPR